MSDFNQIKTEAKSKMDKTLDALKSDFGGPNPAGCAPEERM